MPISLNNFLDKIIKLLILLNLTQVHILKNILYDQMRNIHKRLHLHSKTRCLSQRQTHVWLSGKLNCSFFFHRTIFLLKRMMDKLQLFSIGYLEDTFFKNDKVSLSLQGKQSELVADYKFWTVRWKLEF